MSADALARLEDALGHRFEDRSLLRQALSHRSFVTEHPGNESYERLEFLGDAVLQLAVTRYIFDRYPEASEGEMAKVRASVVSEPTLAERAGELAVADALLLGRGEELTGGREKASILSDVVEALFGAVFLEVGYDVTERIVIDLLSPFVDDRARLPGARDYKTRLQEVLVAEGTAPVYTVVESGPQHAKRFHAVVSAGGRVIGEGAGTSKKRAEQAAAEDAFERRRARQEPDAGAP